MNRPGIVHLRLGRSRGGKHDGMWVTECGHYATARASTDAKPDVNCRSCKRTLAYRSLA